MTQRIPIVVVGGRMVPITPPDTIGEAWLSGAAVPHFIASGDTYTVALYKQALFTMPIDNEGDLVVDGYLVEVS